MRGVITRFAPSPTGRLHLGHAFSAVRARDLARAAGGRFLLRIEDIDGTRSRPEHIAGIIEDLRWLGLGWDGEVLRQSTRLGAYADALAALRGRGLLYPCFCTRADIAASVAAPHGVGVVYPGTCRDPSEAERARRMTEPHAWRLDVSKALRASNPSPSGEGQGWGASDEVASLPDQCSRTGIEPARSPPTPTPSSRGRGLPLIWHDAAAGPVAADPAAHGDVVLARKDAPASYHLAVTLDDAAQGVTDVVRGRDLFAATDIHRLLQALLGLPTPRYHHHPLLTDADGRRLAKRDGAPSLAELRAGGADPRQIVARLRAGRIPVGFAARRD